MRKKATSFRLSAEVLQILSVLAGRMGLSVTSVIELAVRDLARKRGVVKGLILHD